LQRIAAVSIELLGDLLLREVKKESLLSAGEMMLD